MTKVMFGLTRRERDTILAALEMLVIAGDRDDMADNFDAVTTHKQVLDFDVDYAALQRDLKAITF